MLDVAAPSSYKLALECIDSCELLHESCPKSAPKPLPDRVIDCSNPDRPYIVLTGGNMKGRYITLSYIWGGPQRLTTTQNIATYVAYGLEILDFPKTIREAIVATNGLGIRYLWIDALCILQDSDEDKLKQIRMMAKIYRNSYLTLIAACGNNVNEGFLYQDRPQKVPDAKIPYLCPDGRIGSVWIAAVLDANIGNASRSYYDELEPVNYRGWCLQERLLSPRCLIYASHTLQYYCQRETVNIGQALCEPSTHLRLPNELFWSSLTKQLHSMAPSDQIKSRQAWLSVVFEYTTRDITVPGDKLVALAGIVEELHRVYKTEYIAGLWRETLLLDLLWTRSTAYAIKPRPTKYRAPSWSWASIDGLVEYRYLNEEKAKACCTIECEILNCKVTLASEDMPFGEVLAATLNLNSYVMEAKLESKGQSGHVYVQLNLEAEPVKIGWANLDAVEERVDVWITPLMWDKEGEFVEGLILASTLRESYFRRVGRFTNIFGLRDIRWIENASKQIITLV